MSINIIGIDPGQKGAIALLSQGDLTLKDIPLLGKNIDKSALYQILADFKSRGKCFAVLEMQRIMPMQAGQHKIGVQFGYIEMALAILKIPYKIISPLAWKKHFNFPKSAPKAESARIAQQYFPDAEFQTKRNRILDGRADAALMAVYGKKIWKE